jgi:hypothetical protein
MGATYVIGALVAALLFAGIINGSTSGVDYSQPTDDNSEDDGPNSSPPIDRPGDDQEANATSSSLLDTFILGISGVVNTVQNLGVSSKIKLFWAAIGSAEGYGIPGAIPTVTNNRGDLSKGDFGDTGQYIQAGDGEQVIVFPDISTGDAAGYTKLQNIVNGKSQVYNLSMSIQDMGTRWAGNAQVWSANVAAYLRQNGYPNVTPQTKLSEVLT